MLFDCKDVTERRKSALVLMICVTRQLLCSVAPLFISQTQQSR